MRAYQDKNALAVTFLPPTYVCVLYQWMTVYHTLDQSQSIMNAEAQWKDALALQREVLARKNTLTGKLVQVRS